MVVYLPAITAGWLLCAALLVIFHLLWRDAHRSIRYLLGGLAILAGCGLTGLLLDNALFAFGPGAIMSSGLIIVAWTWYDDRTKERLTKAQRTGEIVAAAKGLTQELIDQGGRGNAQRPGHDRHN